jgi:hypothetical protein
MIGHLRSAKHRELHLRISRFLQRQNAQAAGDKDDIASGNEIMRDVEPKVKGRAQKRPRTGTGCESFSLLPPAVAPDAMKNLMSTSDNYMGLPPLDDLLQEWTSHKDDDGYEGDREGEGEPMRMSISLMNAALLLLKPLYI